MVCCFFVFFFFFSFLINLTNIAMPTNLNCQAGVFLCVIHSHPEKKKKRLFLCKSCLLFLPDVPVFGKNRISDMDKMVALDAVI